MIPANIFRLCVVLAIVTIVQISAALPVDTPQEIRREYASWSQDRVTYCTTSINCKIVAEDVSPLVMLSRVASRVAETLYDNKEMVFAFLALAASSSSGQDDSFEGF